MTWIRSGSGAAPVKEYFPQIICVYLLAVGPLKPQTRQFGLENEAHARDTQLQQHTHSPQPSWVHHAHRCALCPSVPDDCALTRYFSFQAHDWFSDVLTGGLILGLWISYLPQVTSLYLSPRVNIEDEVDSSYRRRCPCPAPRSTTASSPTALQRDSAHGFSFSEALLPHRACSTCTLGLASSFSPWRRFSFTLHRVVMQHMLIGCCGYFVSLDLPLC